jgi:outer membrane immunogenic protein
MRSISLAVMLFLGVAATAVAQAVPSAPAPSGDVALTYHWVRTNAQPGDCGCFDLNGGGFSGSWRLRPRWSAVGEFSEEYAGSGPNPGETLRLLSYLGGVRYQLPHTWFGGAHALQPFGQVLVGGGHASGELAGAGEGTNAFVARVGGGLDLPLKGGLAVRVLQADYDVTTFANGVNDHQNNLLLGTGVVYRWSRTK